MLVLLVKKVTPKQSFGEDAVKQVESREGNLTDRQKYVVRHEGFVEGDYIDTKGVSTTGAGRTGDLKDATFKEAFKEREAAAKKHIDNYASYPSYVKDVLTDLAYRGSLKASHKWVKHLNASKPEQAAEELLDNNDYRRSKKNGSGVHKRFDKAHAALLTYAKEQE
jgi:GH24 family phage-related lysozyme (muramidase)